ncbi:UNVERIFIED_CONTAM: hypothetical protein GTU68_024145, partial [Idotea baltica]|nr:hypothetical protein [Idotea baltica]
MIGGFSLSGSIAVSGKIAQNVKLVLHSPKMPTHKLGCEKEKLVGYPNKAKYPLVCHTTPDQKGKYSFSNVPLGKYSVVPHFVSGDVRYVVEPSSVEVEVGHDDVQVQEVFKVQGRSLHGRVTQGKTSPELKGARVTLDGDL